MNRDEALESFRQYPYGRSYLSSSRRARRSAGIRFKQRAACRGRPTATGAWRRRSDRADVLCFLALLAWADVELDALALLQSAVAGGLDCRVVDEHVVAVFALDEAVALLGVEPLHSSCRHSSLVSRSYQLQQRA